MILVIINAPMKNTEGSDIRGKAINIIDTKIIFLISSSAILILGKKYRHNNPAKTSVEYCLKVIEYVIN